MKFLSNKLRELDKKLSDTKKYNQSISSEISKKLQLLDEKINIISHKEKSLLTKENEVLEKIHYFKNLYDDTFSSINWLSERYSDFQFLVDEKSIIYPKYKSASKCSDAQREFAKTNKELRKRNIELELQLRKAEKSFPEISEIIELRLNDEKIDDENLNTTEKIDILVNVIDQKNLTKKEILEKALENYITRQKSKTEIGRDYERYIGYLYEKKGYKVEYHGIKNSYDDLGIDLICTKVYETLLIQCKNWKKSKVIHENSINQLFGTAMKYFLQDSKQNTIKPGEIPFTNTIKPLFITTTNLSERAKEFANIRQVETLQIPFDKEYPRIKCNFGKDEYGLETKIYHLPFDQMYDKINIIKNGGLYVKTITEAEERGFRKAFRWRGE